MSAQTDGGEGGDGKKAADELADARAELTHLRGEVQQLRAEKQRLSDRLTQVAELIEAKSADHLLHDLRNVLNELALLRQLIAGQS